MTAVWLNDELMVSPATVAGLRMDWTDGDSNFGSNADYRKMFWFITVIWISGEAQSVWWGWKAGYEYPSDDARARARVAAEAEMARLSDLLWPEPSRPAWQISRMPDIRVYDPELYGLAVCAGHRTLPSSDPEHCNLAAGHPGDHRFGPTFDEAHPPVKGEQVGPVLTSGFVTAAGGGYVKIWVSRDVESYPAINTHVEVRALP